MYWKEAARRVGVSQANSSRWAHAWNDAGVDGLRPSFGGRPPPKLSDEQFAELCTNLEEGQPWTPRTIHALIEDRYGVTYDPAHLSRKLRASGMHYAKPRPMDPRSPADADEILAERAVGGPDASPDRPQRHCRVERERLAHRQTRYEYQELPRTLLGRNLPARIRRPDGFVILQPYEKINPDQSGASGEGSSTGQGVSVNDFL